MGDICSRFLGQLSDIWTWLLHKSFQKSFQVPGQKFRVEGKKKKKQGDLVDGKVKQEDWAKGVLGMWGGPSVWERADSPQGVWDHQKKGAWQNGLRVWIDLCIFVGLHLLLTVNAWELCTLETPDHIPASVRQCWTWCSPTGPRP